MILRALILFVFAALAVGAAAADDNLMPSEIIKRAYEEAGGEAWLNAETMHLKGSATFYRDGLYGPATVADGYEMWRVYPNEGGAAHEANGLFRLDSTIGDNVMFQTAFDGEQSYDQNGALSAEKQQDTQSDQGFGFGAFRLALTEGYEVARLTDQMVEQHPVYMVKVVDPTGRDTIFAVDKKDFSIRSVQFQTPRGWHERLYSDFMWVDNPRFRQAGRVRHFYNGIMTVDIDWQWFAVNEPMSQEMFQISN